MHRESCPPSKIPCYRLASTDSHRSTPTFYEWEGYDLNGNLMRRKRGYKLDDFAFASVFLKQLTPMLADLIEVAHAVHTIDRLSPRRIAHNGWPRELRLRIQVRDPDRWNSLQLSLEMLLGRYTDDLWKLEFVSRAGIERTSELQKPLFTGGEDNVARPLQVCLFSGGLDSLNGAVRQLLVDGHIQLICVAGSTNSWIGDRQAYLVRSLALRFGARVTLLPVLFNLEQPTETWSEESTQRTRGFIHLVIGAIAAVLAAVDKLTIHENGVGALNLPYSPGQLGTQLTRATHPLVLAEASEWLSSYLESPFRVQGSSLSLTKAKASVALIEAELGHLIGDTFSCDGFQRVAGRPQCGTCTSCLLRRQAVHAAGLTQYDPADRYCLDVTDPSCAIPENHRDGLRLMLEQRDVLGSCLSAGDPWSALMGEFPALWDLQSRVNEWNAVGGPNPLDSTLVDMYRSYVTEWEHFPVDSFPYRGIFTGSASAV